MIRGPWFNSGLQRLTVSLGRDRQSGDRLDLSIFWLYGLLWVPPLLAAILLKGYLSPSGLYYGEWLFTYVPALAGFFILQQEYRPTVTQFGMTLKHLRSPRVWLWSSAAVGVAVLWFGILYWFAGTPGGPQQSTPVPPSTASEAGNLVSCSHPLFAGVLGIVVAPTIEEFLFRGYLYLLLRQNRGHRFAALVSSGIFSIMHGANAPVVFFQALIYVYFDNFGSSLCPSIVGHAAWNGALLLLCGHAI
jgi:membrane protease YdiL (CAAX protease family)